MYSAISNTLCRGFDKLRAVLSCLWSLGYEKENSVLAPCSRPWPRPRAALTSARGLQLMRIPSTHMSHWQTYKFNAGTDKGGMAHYLRRLHKKRREEWRPTTQDSGRICM